MTVLLIADKTHYTKYQHRVNYTKFIPINLKHSSSNDLGLKCLLSSTLAVRG